MLSHILVCALKEFTQNINKDKRSKRDFFIKVLLNGYDMKSDIIY